MSTAVRPATLADAAAIERLSVDVQAVHAAGLPELFKGPGVAALPATLVTALLNVPSVRLLVAEVDGVPAGYAYVEIRRRPEDAIRLRRDVVFVHHLSVGPAHQRRGVGRALMSAVRALADGLGIGTVELDVWAFNEPARRFFAQQGFATFNERMWARSA